MRPTPNLRRGQWAVRDTPEGFTLTVRPVIGPLCLISELYILGSAASAAVLFFLAVTASQITTAVVLGVAGLVLLATGAFVSVGFAWLAFGWTTLSVEGDDVLLQCHRHPTCRDALRFPRSEWGTLTIDNNWVARGLRLLPRGKRIAHDRGVLLGACPNRGPLRVKTSSGSSLSFGGDLSFQTAESIRAALLARACGDYGAELSAPDPPARRRHSVWGVASFVLSVIAFGAYVALWSWVPVDPTTAEVDLFMVGVLSLCGLALLAPLLGLVSLFRTQRKRSLGFIGLMLGAAVAVSVVALLATYA